MWNNLFRVRLPQGSNAEVVVSGGVVIHVWSRQGVNPYFDMPLLESVNGWRKMWFLLRNDAAAPS
jgi:hypothetical protein